MFENYRELSDSEKNEIKAIHKALRKNGYGRYKNLAWAFVRGFPYRRVERTTRSQVMADGSIVEHNRPSAQILTATILESIPNFVSSDPKRPWLVNAHPDIEKWLDDPNGAIPAPVRVKKPYMAAQVAE